MGGVPDGSCGGNGGGNVYPYSRLYGVVMTDNDFLRPSELAALLRVSERRARQILGELEALGFTLPVAPHGARMIPSGLAGAVRAARARGHELPALRLDESLARYLKNDDQDDDLDVLALLIEARGEQAVLREIIGALHKSLASGSMRLGYVAPADWSFLGVPDPKRGM